MLCAKFNALFLLFALLFSSIGYGQDFNVQHIQNNIARTGGTTSFTPVSSTNSAFVLPNNNRKTHAGRTDETDTNLDSDDLSGAVRLTANNTLTYFRNSGSLNTNMKFSSSIWEYTGTPGGNNQFIVRDRLIVNLNGITNNITQAVSGVTNANKCIPFITGIVTNASDDDADSGTAIAYLENATTLRVQKGSNANNVSVYITLVEFTGSNWTILHGDSGPVNADTGSVNLRANSNGTGTPTSVTDWANSMIFTQHRGNMDDNGVDDAIADNWPLMSPGSNNQTVDWTFNSDHDAKNNGNRHFVHVANNPEISVTRFNGNNDNGAGESTFNITSSGLTSINQALIIGTSTSSGNGTAYGRGWRNYQINSPTQAAHWSHRSGNAMNHEIQIVKLYEDYCTPSSTSTSYYIDDFSTTGGTTNITNNNTGTGITSNGYSDYTAQSASQIAGSVLNFSTDFSDRDTTFGFNIWVDWNQNAIFENSERVYASNAYVTGATGNFTIPGATAAGNYTMRIRNDFYITNPNPCSSINRGEAEDYTLRVVPPGTVTYCEPTSEGPEYVYIDDIRFMGTLNDVDNLNSGYSNGYQDFTNLPHAVQAQGEGMNIYYNNESYSGGAHVKAWVDWNKNGDFSDSGELVYDTGTVSTSSATFGVIIPLGTPIGDYRIRIRNNVVSSSSSYDFDSCEDFDYTNRNYSDGEAEDYIFTVIPACNANIVTVIDGDNCGPGTVDLSITGTAGTTGFKWYSSETGGTLLYDDTASTGTWTTPNISTTTTYWVTAYNGTCESYFRTPVIANINPTPTVIFTPSNPIFCGEEAIQITAGGDVEEVVLVNENFEDGGLGVFTNNNDNPNGNPYDGITAWQNETSPYIPNNTEVWSPAISSGLSGNHFVMSTSDVNPPTGNVYQYLQLTTPVDASNMTNLTLTFDMYYSNFGDQIRIQANGGTGWNTLSTYTTSEGIGTRFENQSINLPTSYNSSSSLSIRIQFRSGWGDGIAVDNIKLFGTRPLTTSFNYDTSAVNAYTDAAATIPYTSGNPATTIWIKPTEAQLNLSTFNIPVTSTLSNGCTANGSVTVTNNTRVFTGATTDWNNPSHWKPAVLPTLDNCVIINPTNPTVINSGSVGSALNVIVNPNGNLEVNGTLLIQEDLDVKTNGNFVVNNNASLIQIDNIQNTGKGTIKRNSITNSNDYVYWSSPVSNFNISNVPGNASYYWIPTINSNGIGHYGDWAAASGSMNIGQGYIKRSGTNGTITSNFTNRINNGDITVPITRGNYTGPNYYGTGNSTEATNLDDNWNLIGNPYPSAIFADSFIIQNAGLLGESPSITGTVYLWTHASAPSTSNNPFYGDFVYNYNPNDYIAYNLSGPNPVGFQGNIASGQGFFVLMDHSAATPSNIVFNNSMRSASYDNSQFYRTNQDPSPTEKHRIWLDLIAPNNMATSILVGYIENATDGLDLLYDGYDLSETSTRFYSLIGEEKMAIQGKALPFIETDLVPLGLLIPQPGNYTIAINTLDGLFETGAQDIYLEDTFTGIIHDLRVNPYSFNAEVGTFNNRFVLRYTNDVLSNEEFNTIKDLSITAPKNDYIKITSAKDVIKDIVVYDLLGKVIFDTKNILKSEVIINDLKNASGTFIVKVTLANGLQKTQKVILK
ncbi:hypothetical protein GCM10010976_28830 [Bizionia arctica]|uniref:T9SS type A sorting domain-containing protein n=2 Tax=Bizionia arctica TaxID=1495645 RepID=A0A917GTU3_9FLAO|nr:hypothetical protein GCM10010976_28830 [Bizionia arctica]